jgi:hypothetical protein
MCRRGIAIGEHGTGRSIQQIAAPWQRPAHEEPGQNNVHRAAGKGHPVIGAASPCYFQHASLLFPTPSLLWINRENGVHAFDPQG